MTSPPGRNIALLALPLAAFAIRLIPELAVDPSRWLVAAFIAVLVVSWVGGAVVGISSVVLVAGLELVIIQNATGPLPPAIAEANPTLDIVNGLLAVFIGVIVRVTRASEQRSRARAVRVSRVAAGSEARFRVILDVVRAFDDAGSTLQVGDLLARAARSITGAASAAVYVSREASGPLIRLAHDGAIDPSIPASIDRGARAPVPAAARTRRPATTQTVLAVPLLSGDQSVGVVELRHPNEDSLDQGSMAASLALGRLAAMALERIQLRDDRRAAGIAAGQAGDRVVRLERLTASLASAVTEEAIGRAVVEHAVEALGAPVGLFHVLGPAGDLQLVHHRGYPVGLARHDARIRLDASLPVTDAIRSGNVVIVDSPAAWRQVYPGTSDVLAMTGTRSVVAVPIGGPGSPPAALVLHRAGEGSPPDKDLAVLLVVAQQAAGALERARLYAHERERGRLQEAFIGVISHELRTPITTILAGSKLLSRDQGMSALGRELAQDVEGEADRLFRLVEDLLVLSRLERGQLAIGEEPVHVTRVFERAVASEASRWPATRFVLPRDRTAQLARGEETYVEQVARNLLTNAAKYGPPGGTVTIELERVDEEVVARILDEGPGVASEEVGQLFDLYYRSPTTAARAAGAGIGLFVCRRLIDGMGGRIWAHRRQGGGSEFGFALSAYPVEDDEPQPPLPAARVRDVATPATSVGGAAADVASATGS